MDSIEILLLPLYVISLVVFLLEVWVYLKTPAWGFALLFGVFAVLIFCFWRRKAFWVSVLAVVVLLASPLWVEFVSNRTGGTRALQASFPDPSFSHARVVKYRLYPSSFGDKFEFWKVELADADAHRKRSGKAFEGGHTPLDATHVHLPGWWPDSRKGYMVYEKSSFAGATEIWTPERGSTFYLFKAQY